MRKFDYEKLGKRVREVETRLKEIKKLYREPLQPNLTYKIMGEYSHLKTEANDIYTIIAHSRGRVHNRYTRIAIHGRNGTTVPARVANGYGKQEKIVDELREYYGIEETKPRVIADRDKGRGVKPYLIHAKDRFVSFFQNL